MDPDRDRRPHAPGCGIAIDNNNEIINGGGAALRARDIVVRNWLGGGCRRTLGTQHMKSPARFPDASPALPGLRTKNPISASPRPGRNSRVSISQLGSFRDSSQ
jgi:hypothetical protein